MKLAILVICLGSVTSQIVPADQCEKLREQLASYGVGRVIDTRCIYFDGSKK